MIPAVTFSPVLAANRSQPKQTLPRFQGTLTPMYLSDAAKLIERGNPKQAIIGMNV